MVGQQGQAYGIRGEIAVRRGKKLRSTGESQSLGPPLVGCCVAA